MGKRTFFSFRSSVDWKRGWQAQLTQQTGVLAIEKEQVYRQCYAKRLEQRELTGAVIDMSADATGKWYLLEDTENIWRLDVATQQVERVVKLESNDQLRPAHIAVTTETIAILFNSDYSTISIMQMEGTQIRAQIDDWFGEKFTAYAIEADLEGGWLVIATLAGQTALQLLRFDSYGRPTRRLALDEYMTIEASEELVDASLPLLARFQIILDDAQTCWILERGTKKIAVIQLTTNHLVSLLPLPPFLQQRHIVSIGYSMQQEQAVWWFLVKEEGETERLALIGCNQQQQMMQRGYVSRSHADRLVVSKQAVFLWEAQEKVLTRVEPVLEPAIWELTGSRSGVWISYGLDSGEHETIWHRLTMLADVPHDSQVNIRYYASDSQEIWAGDKRVILDDWLQDTTISAADKLTALQPYWSKPLHDPEDALLRHAKGRYMWVQIELLGSAQHTPMIEQLQIYFPRQSYMQYLPSIYEQTAAQDQFLERYLTLFQTMIEEVEDGIEGVTRKMQVNQASGSSLRWLLGWLGIESDDFWNDEQLRLLLQEAPQLYALRGTKQALMRLIEIYTGERPIILEYEQVKPLKENVDIGEVADRLYAADPHTFNVLVKAEHVATELKRMTLQQLIEAYKPAFTTFKLIILQPWVYMDLHSYLGMNTILSEPTLLTLDNQSSMPHHTITIDTSGENRMDQHTRLGLNSRLE